MRGSPHLNKPEVDNSITEGWSPIHSLFDRAELWPGKFGLLLSCSKLWCFSTRTVDVL